MSNALSVHVVSVMILDYCHTCIVMIGFMIMYMIILCQIQTFVVDIVNSCYSAT